MNRKARIILRLAWWPFVFLVVQWFDPYAWMHRHKPPPPPPPLRYQYFSFLWPKGTRTGVLFYVGDSDKFEHDVLTLSEILDKVRRQTGYEYCGAAADTIILRQLAPDDPDSVSVGGPPLSVEPTGQLPKPDSGRTNRQP